MAKEITVKVNDELEAKVPLSWNDITISQFLRLKKYKEHNDIELLSIMLNVDKEMVITSTNPDLDIDVYPHLKWYMDDSLVAVIASAKKLEVIKVGDKEVKVPKDLMAKTFAQKIAMEQVVEQYEDPYDAMSDILAIYLYPEYYNDRKFDIEQIDDFKKQYIDNLSIVVAYPICTFFLRKLKESMSKKLQVWLENIPNSKKEQVFSSLRSLSTLKQ